jgi:putative transposase
VVRVNQVWSTDTTYIRLWQGFTYLVAIIDWYSRRVLSWRISNTMEAVFCVDCLEDAMREHGNPEVLNSAQGTPFNSEAFTGVLLIGLTTYFAFYNGQRPHQALKNQTPDAVHNSSVGGGAMIVDKYGAKPEPSGLSIALRCTATAFGEVKIENQSEMQNTKTGAAPFSCVKSGVT